MPKDTEPVLIVLPDASIQMIDVESFPEGVVVAGDVLRDHPGHSLGRVPDPRRSKLSADTPLKPGATYFLARLLPFFSSSTMNPIPVIVLPPTPTGASSLANRGNSFIPPPSPASTNPMSWRSSSIGSESSCSDMVGQSMDSFTGDCTEDNLATAPPPVLSLSHTTSASTPYKQGPGAYVQRSPIGQTFSPHNSSRSGSQQHHLSRALSTRALKPSYSEKEKRLHYGGWSPYTSPHNYSQEGSPATCNRSMRFDAVSLHDDSCQIVSPASANESLFSRSSSSSQVQLPTPHHPLPPQLPSAGLRQAEAHKLPASASTDSQPRSSNRQAIRRAETYTSGGSTTTNPILRELHELAELGPVEEASISAQRKVPRVPRQQEGKSSVAAKLGAALGRMGLMSLVKGKSVQEKVGKRGSGRRAIQRANTEVREVDVEGEIEYHDSTDLHQEWNSSSTNPVFYSTPFQRKDLQGDLGYKKRQLQEW